MLRGAMLGVLAQFATAQGKHAGDAYIYTRRDQIGEIRTSHRTSKDRVARGRISCFYGRRFTTFIHTDKRRTSTISGSNYSIGTREIKLLGYEL
jgi:hypothetical protein